METEVKKLFCVSDCNSEDDGEHYVGDPDCSSCFGIHYPKKCKCGGLIHSDFGDELGEDCEYFLIYKCDKCGDNYEFAEGTKW